MEYVVGFDFDQSALEKGVALAQTSHLPLQFLFLDGVNPTPNQGWNEMERPGLKARAKANGVLALAFVHHFAIAKNIPSNWAIDWIISLAPDGVIEFVPKNDPKVQELLRQREDIFPDYTEENFLRFIKQKAEIVRSETISNTGRLLIQYTQLGKDTNLG